MALSNQPFALIGIREVLESYIDSPPLIETLATNIEQAITDESPTVFELSKALIDSTCKTILLDRGVELSRDWDTPQLFRETQSQLNFIPPEHPNPQTFHEGMRGILRGLQQAIQGLCELRNSEGIISHGQDGYERFCFSLINFNSSLAPQTQLFIFYLVLIAETHLILAQKEFIMKIILSLMIS